MDSSEIDEAIKHYYKLKGDYDKKYANAKHNIFVAQMSKKTAIAKLKRIKQKCVSCKKNGGTIFTNTNRILTAKCGSETPCSLDIQIRKPNIIEVHKALEMVEIEKNDSKAAIINLKLDLLFGFKTEEEISTVFEEEKEHYRANVKQGDTLQHILNNAEQIISDDPKTGEEKIFSINQYTKIKKNKLKKHVNEFKSLIKEYMDEDEVTAKNAKMKGAINIYKEQIIPLMKKIREGKHELITMVEEDEQFRMIKLKYLPDRFEFPYESGEIISNKK